MPASFQTSRRVEFRDTDAAGIMHFASILGIMEESEHEFLRHLEIPLFNPVDGGQLSWPRVACSAEFKSPARLAERLTIEVAIEKLGKKSVTYFFALRSGERLVATGKMTCAHCLVGEHQLEAVEIPTDVSNKLAQYVIRNESAAS